MPKIGEDAHQREGRVRWIVAGLGRTYAVGEANVIESHVSDFQQRPAPRYRSGPQSASPVRSRQNYYWDSRLEESLWRQSRHQKPLSPSKRSDACRNTTSAEISKIVWATLVLAVAAEVDRHRISVAAGASLAWPSVSTGTNFGSSSLAVRSDCLGRP